MIVNFLPGLVRSCQVAVTRGTPIMSPEWVERCWEQREDPQANAIQPPLADNKQLPFQGCVIGLRGFSQEEEEDMKKSADLNGEDLVYLVMFKCVG